MKSTVYIQNLKCGGCENTIISELSKMESITNVTVNHEYDAVNFEHQTTEDFEAVKKELYKLGYPPFGEGNTVFKKAKSFVSCAIGRVNKNRN